MVVGVDESWGDDFAVAVDFSGGSWWTNVRFDLGDGVAFDEKVGVLEGGYGVVGVVGQEGAALKEHGSGGHHGGQGRKRSEGNVRQRGKIESEGVIGCTYPPRRPGSDTEKLDQSEKQN